jgi:molecular chaperone GrpE
MNKNDEAKTSDNFKVRDRHFWNDEEASKTIDSPLPGFVQQLEAQLAEKDLEIAKFAEALRLQRDEQKKVRERLERDQQNAVLNLKIQVLEPLLELYDNLELCTKSLEQELQFKNQTSSTLTGMQLIVNQFMKSFENLGVKRLKLVGESYNPEVAEAVATEKCDDAKLDNLVLEEYRSGYKIEDRLIRPARVRVAQYQKELRSHANPQGNDNTSPHSQKT